MGGGWGEGEGLWGKGFTDGDEAGGGGEEVENTM